ncbi:MAG: hypothetical protein IH964_10160 [Candidatus Dadabacteria bacterium]|nr:hypothetical protein [Candidatus Dadabacteria bacterium]
MVTKDFQVIPNEIINLWLRGEYYSGDILPISYQYIGISIALRGWYTYKADIFYREEGKYEIRDSVIQGVAKIDIKDKSLFVGGVRLLSQNKPQFLFWRSEFSHFLNEKEIISYYKIFYYDVDKMLLDKGYIDNSFVKSIKPLNESSNFGLSIDQWNRLLCALRNSFDDDIETVEAECYRKEEKCVIKGILHFSIKEFIENLGRNEYEPIKALYRQVYPFPEEAEYPKGEKFILAGRAEFKSVKLL